VSHIESGCNDNPPGLNHFYLFFIYRMAITKGAKKAIRVSERKHVVNVRRSRALKNTVKAVEKLVTAGKKEEAKKLVPETYQAIDKAAKRGIIKKNTASRKKARISRITK
jgi:small subunit ribosomal protein S20